MSVADHASAPMLTFPTTGAPRPQPHGVLAVVGGCLDAAVLNLARTLASPGEARIDLLLLVEVPAAFPMGAYGRYMAAHGAYDALDAAAAICGEALGEATILLCRNAGRALAAEIRTRNSADLVIGAPSGGWWARRRAHRAIAHVQRRAACRVFVVHVPPPAAPEQRYAAAR
jgi:hypothetical protein